MKNWRQKFSIFYSKQLQIAKFADKNLILSDHESIIAFETFLSKNFSFIDFALSMKISQGK